MSQTYEQMANMKILEESHKVTVRDRGQAEKMAMDEVLEK